MRTTSWCWSLPVALAACATRPLPPADAMLLAHAAAIRCRPDEIARGRALLVGPCAACHEPVHPLDCTLAVWDAVMPRMLTKSELPPAEGAAVRAYVLAVQHGSGVTIGR